MLIDWFTTGAQIINFLILVWLMKRFLYGPIIKAMDDRERAIASRLSEAEAGAEEAAREAAAYRERQRAFDEERDAFLGQAVQDAAARREELIEEARRETARLRARWRDAVEQEKDSLLRDLRHRVAAQVCAATRHALSEMGDADLERAMVRGFIRRLRALDRAALPELSPATRGREPDIVIASAFDVPAEERDVLTALLNERLDRPVEIVWTTDPDLLCGIQLTARGHKIAWSFDQFVRDLERDVGGLLEGGEG